MHATITPGRTAFAIKVFEFGVAGQDGAALIYKGKCSFKLDDEVKIENPME